MELALSLVAAGTRLASNVLVSRHRWYGWPMKVPSMFIFTWFNYKFGLWGLHLLTAADLYVTLRAMKEWKNER